MTDPAVTDDLYKTVTDKHEEVRNATVQLNETSEQYRSTLVSINDKLIFLSAGSISLLLTFVGILFNGDRDISSLNYPFIIASILCLLISVTLLLLSRWCLSLHVFSMVHNLYLGVLKEQTEVQLDMYKAYPFLVKPKTYERYTDGEIGEIIENGEKKYKLIHQGETKGKKKEILLDYLFKVFAITGYLCFLVGYLLAALFFIGVVKLMAQ